MRAVHQTNDVDYGHPKAHNNPGDPHSAVEQHRELRQWWLILISVFCVHLVLLLNYMHLQRMQKVTYSTQTARVIRLIVFTLMPTLVIAELIINVGRTFLTLLTMEVESFTATDLWRDARRYLCGLLGMHASPKPAFEEDIGVEVEARASDEEQYHEQETPLPDTNKDVCEPLPPLSMIQHSDDLQVHKQRWSTATVLRTLILVLPVAQAAGTILLYDRAGAYMRHTHIGFDRRNLMAAVSSVVCSIVAIMLICCRREWSLKPLSNSTIREKDSSFRIFVLEFVIASCIDVAPFNPWYEYDIMPFSWFDILTRALGLGGLVAVVVVLAAIWLALTLLQSQLKARMPRINWRFVTLLATLPVAGLLVWICVDLVSYVVYDLTQVIGIAIGSLKGLAEYADPLAKFIPFC